MEKHPDVVWSPGALSRAERFEALGIRGATIWLTGLSGSGKSTLASATEEHLIAHHRPAFRLDGDNVRCGLNSDLGFDRAGRDENVRRVAEVAKLFAEAGVVAVVALISPYAEARRRARELHESAGIAFIEVYVATSVADCEVRDPKGLYERARKGTVSSLTGVDDPYEVPTSPELVVDGTASVDESVGLILGRLGLEEDMPAADQAP